jgi:hypothetical protein
MSKKVMIGWQSNDYHVTEQGIAIIKDVIAHHQICPKCNERIDSSDHLLVGKKCLACVLKDNEGLTLVGYQRDDDEGRAIYTFINTAGITFTSTANSSEKPYEDVALSIEEAGFTIPTTYKQFKSDEVIELDRRHWSVFGKLPQSVVLIQYKDTYRGRNGVEAMFIAYKGGQTVEMNKRSTEHKNLLEKARMLAERTKRGNAYHLPHISYSIAQLNEEHLYPIIATLESAVWDAQLAFIETTEPEETEPFASDITVTHNEEPTPLAEIDIAQEQEEPALELPETVIVGDQEATSEPVQIASRRKRKQEQTSDATTSEE